MKRSPLQRRSPLRRGAPMQRGAPIRQRSAKRQRAYSGKGGRAEFVAETLAVRQRCEVVWDSRCSGRSEHVHEAITRKRGGAIVPGALADAQGQRFYAVCWHCHALLHDHPALASERGFLMRNPLSPATGVD